jgi:uncharacterized protein YbjT (DUF2867 family)
MKVFVAGATGATGQRVIAELCQRQIPVRALVRDVNKAREIWPTDSELVDLVVGDVGDSLALQQAIGDCTAVICATGARPSLDPTGPYQVDYIGTKNLVDAAKLKNIQHFSIVSSLCVSKLFHPLNLFWLILYWKQQGENYLRASGLNYTIVRPGGLKNDQVAGSLVMSRADTLFEGSIPRQKVAEVCVESLFQPTAINKVVEIVCQSTAIAKDWPEMFANV